MSQVLDRDFLIETQKGAIPKHSIVHKFGRNAAVGTSFVPITLGGVYRTKQVAGAVALRVKAGGDANDTAAGTGAREVTFQGLDETGALVEEAVATAGASASVATTTTFIRLFRAWVSSSGTYATTAAGSHAADIVIEDSGGAEDWATIDATAWPRGQTEIAVYSVPLTYTAFVLGITMFSDSSKTSNAVLFQRQNILETAAPYTAMREVVTLFSTGNDETLLKPRSPWGPFPALTDIGFMGKVNTGTSELDVDFEILLVQD